MSHVHSQEKRMSLDDVVILCPHLKSPVPALVKKAVAEQKSFTCKLCSDVGHRAAPSVWMCLSCGHIGCCRTESGGHDHAKSHHATNPGHFLAVELRSGDVWCYGCDDAIASNESDAAFSRLRDCEEILRSSGVATKTVPAGQKPSAPVQRAPQQQKAGKKGSARLAREREAAKARAAADMAVEASARAAGIRGLRNLGNTCFYNSILQNLSHTTPLVRAFIGRPEVVVIPGEKEGDPVQKIVEWNGAKKLASGPVTNGIVALMEAMHKQQDHGTGAYSPSDLFAAVCRKVPRFKSFQQQDAHELLVFVLDAMSREQRSVAAPQKKEADAKGDGQEQGDGEGRDDQQQQQKKKVEELQHRTVIEDVFGGETVSAVTCHVCGEVSFTRESFLNLSVPLPERLTRKYGATEESMLFIGKGAKSRKNPYLAAQLFATETPVQPRGLSKHQIKKMRKRGITFTPPAKLKAAASTPKEEPSPSAAESKDAAAAASTPGASAEKPVETTADPPKQDTPEKAADSVKQDTPEKPADAPKEGEPAKEAVAAEKSETPAGSGEPTATTGAKESTPEGGKKEEERREEGSAEEVPPKKKDITIEDFRIAPPSLQSTGGCSLQECLAAYTSPEFLTGINSYRCRTCAAAAETGQKKEEPELEPAPAKATRTKKGKEKAKDEPAPILSDATKQIVIRSLPEVLIIQIKRFLQTGRGRLEKISENVEIPVVLNMMPYCERGSPAAEAGQAVYVLFGTSEHSGSLSGGHYTATVNTGSDWYHCSDTCVTRSNIQRAVAGSAYLLFYERKITPPKEAIPAPVPTIATEPEKPTPEPAPPATPSCSSEEEKK